MERFENILFFVIESINWEYSSRRQIAYDALVYSLASRFPKDLNKRIDYALKEVSSECEFLMSKWPMIEWQNKIQRQIIIALFLLEEFKIKSNSFFIISGVKSS